MEWGALYLKKMITDFIGHDNFRRHKAAQYNPPDELITWFLEHNRFDRNEIEFLLRLLANKKTIVDIGANIGIHSVNYAYFINGATVYAIEPAQENLIVLKKNIDKHKLTNIRIVEKAIGKENSKGTLYVNEQNSGDNRIYKSPDFEPMDSHGIEIITLDQFKKENDIGKIDYIKMDTQGCEFDIFEGGYKTLKEDRPDIFMEFWPWGLIQKLGNQKIFKKVIEDFGYNVFKSEEQTNWTINKTPTPLDEIFRFYKKYSHENFHMNLFLSADKTIL